jgi:hypothetical protein
MFKAIQTTIDDVKINYLQSVINDIVNNKINNKNYKRLKNKTQILKKITRIKSWCIEILKEKIQYKMIGPGVISPYLWIYEYIYNKLSDSIENLCKAEHILHRHRNDKIIGSSPRFTVVGSYKIGYNGEEWYMEYYKVMYISQCNYRKLKKMRIILINKVNDKRKGMLKIPNIQQLRRQSIDILKTIYEAKRYWIHCKENERYEGECFDEYVINSKDKRAKLFNKIIRDRDFVDVEMSE